MTTQVHVQDLQHLPLATAVDHAVRQVLAATELVREQPAGYADAYAANSDTIARAARQLAALVQQLRAQSEPPLQAAAQMVLDDVDDSVHRNDPAPFVTWAAINRLRQAVAATAPEPAAAPECAGCHAPAGPHSYGCTATGALYCAPCFADHMAECARCREDWL